MDWTIAITLLLLFIVCSIVFLAVLKKSKKVKYIVWGLTTMFVIAPFFSWALSTIYAVIEKEGFAGVAMMMLLFPILFMVGLVLLLVGVFKKFNDTTMKSEGNV